MVLTSNGVCVKILQTCEVSGDYETNDNTPLTTIPDFPRIFGKVGFGWMAERLICSLVCLLQIGYPTALQLPEGGFLFSAN